MTTDGKHKFGQMIAEARNKLELADNEQLSDWLYQRTDIRVGVATLTRIEEARYQKTPSFDVLVAIIQSELIKHPDGTPFSLDDLRRLIV